MLCVTYFLVLPGFLSMSASFSISKLSTLKETMSSSKVATHTQNGRFKQQDSSSARDAKGTKQVLAKKGKEGVIIPPACSALRCPERQKGGRLVRKTKERSKNTAAKDETSSVTKQKQKRAEEEIKSKAEGGGVPLPHELHAGLTIHRALGPFFASQDSKNLSSWGKLYPRG
jgi:hypothetical protein